MKKFECQLCGGKLRNGRCELCGWVNQSESHYLLNKSSCDTKHLTHVHEENTYGAHKAEAGSKNKTSSESKKRIPYQASRMPYQPKSVKKKGKGLSVLAVLIALISLAPSIFKVTQETISNFSDSSVVHQAEDELYDLETRELSDTGEKWSMEIRPGIYKVGVDIPEGLYNLEAVSGGGTFYLDDEQDYIYYNEYLTDDPQGENEFSGIDDIRLYQGASVRISDGLTLRFSTETGQTD